MCDGLGVTGRLLGVVVRKIKNRGLSRDRLTAVSSQRIHREALSEMNLFPRNQKHRNNIRRDSGATGEYLNQAAFGPVIVVQTTKNRRRDDAPPERNVVTIRSWVDGKIAGGVGDIWAERRMRSRSIVVGHPRTKNAPEMRRRKRDEEVQALPACRANQSLTI